jgi:hypothetical protein
MMLLLCAALASWLALVASAAADWRADVVPAHGRVTAVETAGMHAGIATASWVMR